MPISANQPFDLVTYFGDIDDLRRLSHEEYMRLPIRERVKLLIGGKLKFYKGGQEIPATQALKG